MAATTVVPQRTVTAARMYAIREIVRRAGVSAEDFRSWQCSEVDSWTVLRLGPNHSKTIRFPTTPGAPSGGNTGLVRNAVRAAWTLQPSPSKLALIPDFVVPFVDSHQQRVPIFTLRDSDTIDFTFDLPAAVLLTLSRREEEDDSIRRDPHGRFPAAASIAVRFDFLHRPIVDEYGLAMEQALCCLLPNWQPAPRELRVKLSHDIDNVGIPFALRTTIGHALSRREPLASARDFLSTFSSVRPVHLALVQELISLSAQYKLDSAIYWKAGPATDFDTGYDPMHPKVQRTVAWLEERGIECGVHPGYQTYDSPERLQSELVILRKALHRVRMGGRQHYLRWKPDTWRQWEECNLSYDSTVGFADRLGFRAGTCIPYRPWLFSQDREANLLEIPLIAMDCTPIRYMGLSEEESFHKILECVERCRLVGGVFTLLWHNTELLDPMYGNLYPRLLQRLSGAGRFDCFSPFQWQAAA